MSITPLPAWVCRMNAEQALSEPLGDVQNAKHLYSVEVEGPRQIDVHANNRDQASRIAARAGFIVRSVNMVG